MDYELLKFTRLEDNARLYMMCEVTASKAGVRTFSGCELGFGMQYIGLCSVNDVYLQPGYQVKVKSGYSVVIPKGYKGIVLPVEAYNKFGSFDVVKAESKEEISLLFVNDSEEIIGIPALTNFAKLWIGKV